MCADAIETLPAHKNYLYTLPAPSDNCMAGVGHISSIEKVFFVQMQLPTAATDRLVYNYTSGL